MYVHQLQCAISFLVFMTQVWSLESKGVAAQTLVHGEVGGAVTFKCKYDPLKTPEFLYIQRPSLQGAQDQEFINGYHHLRLLTPHPKYANRTHVDLTQGTMEMRGIGPSDDGLYKCIIKYHQDIINTEIRLNVTANYSTPTVTVACKQVDGNLSDYTNCLVTCSSHGGYPGSEVEWFMTLNKTQWRVLNSSKDSDPVSMLVNTSSTLSVNCSFTSRPHYLHCIVGGPSSQVYTICEDKPEIDSPGIRVNIACVAIVVGLILLILLVIIPIIKKRKTPIGNLRTASAEEVAMQEHHCTDLENPGMDPENRMRKVLL